MQSWSSWQYRPQDAIGIIDEEDLSDIVLVGHSYGGMVISGVADRVPEGVATLVYLYAFVPENGQSLFNLLPPDRRLATVPGEGGWQRQHPRLDSASNVQRLSRFGS